MRDRRGHIFLDLAVLVLVACAACLYLQAGLAHRSLMLTLAGALGLGFAAAFLLAALVEGAAGSRLPGFSAVLFVPAVAAGTLAGAAWGFTARAVAPALAGFGAGVAAGLAAGFSARRLPALERALEPVVGQGVLWVFLAYLTAPPLYFLLSALALPFVEGGFLDGLKVAAALAALAGAAWAFFAALSRWAWLRALALGGVVFGVLLGFAALLTVDLLASLNPSEAGLCAALAAEAAACAVVSWLILRRSPHERA